MAYSKFYAEEVESMVSGRRGHIHVGDRVITPNCRLGTVLRLDRDELGDYIVVQLDLLKGEFAYDPWDLERV